MPKIRENSRLERTHGSPDPILESDNKSGSDQIGLQEKESPPVDRKHCRPPRNLQKILQDNNWDSVVDLIFRRSDDSPVLDALNSFGLEFGLPIMRALDSELSKDLIYSEDEEDVLPPEPQEKEKSASSATLDVKQLGREEKRTEKNKRKKLRRKKKKHEWKKENSAYDMSEDEEDDDDDDDEQESKEEESVVEKTSAETEQAHLESSATLTEAAATGVGNDSDTTDEANPDSSATSTLTETAATGVGNDSETTDKANPESSAPSTLTETAATGVGNDSETTDKANPESSAPSTLTETAATGVGNDSDTTDKANPESSAPSTLTETAATGVGNDSETTDKANPESSATSTLTETGVGNDSETMDKATLDSSVTETAATGVENDSASGLHEVESNKEPDENLKEVEKESLDVSTAGSPMKNQLDETPKLEDETPKLLDETPNLEDKGKHDSSPVVHDPEEQSVQEKTEVTKPKKDPQIVKHVCKQKIKPSKTSDRRVESPPVHDPEGKKSVQEKTEERKPKKDPKFVKQKIKPSKTSDRKDDSSPVHDAEEKKSVQEKAETEETKPKNDPKFVKQKIKPSKTSDRRVESPPVHDPEENKSVQEKTDETKPQKDPKFVKQKIKPFKTSDRRVESPPVHDPEENKSVQEKTEETKPKKDPKFVKQKIKPFKTSDRRVESPPVHDPEENKSVQEKTEETKPKKDPKFVKQKIKPSKTSDHKETNNIEGSREIKEPSVSSPLRKKTAIGGFSNNSGSNDDIVIKEGDGNLEPTVRNMEVVPEHLAKKSTELAAVGNRFAACGQYEAAVKCYTDAIKCNPQEFKLFGNRSLCYERMQDYERALADARLALFMEPKWLKGLFRKGKALCGLKRYFEASLVYKEILQQESSSAEAAQELKRAQTLHLMEMGFTWGQSSEALKNHATLEEAIDALFGSEGRRGRSEGRRSQSAEHDVSQDKINGQMEETEDEDKKMIPVGKKQPSIRKVNTPTSVDRARTKSQSPTGVKTIGENCDLWVGSLAPTVTKVKLVSIFARAGVVTNVTMISNQQYAFVKFTKKEACDKAINMLNGMVVEGSPLLVRPSNRSRF